MPANDRRLPLSAAPCLRWCCRDAGASSNDPPPPPAPTVTPTTPLGQPFPPTSRPGSPLDPHPPPAPPPPPPAATTGRHRPKARAWNTWTRPGDTKRTGCAFRGESWRVLARRGGARAGAGGATAVGRACQGGRWASNAAANSSSATPGPEAACTGTGDGGRVEGASRPDSVSGSHSLSTTHWKRAIDRVRRWLMPTTFAPVDHLARAEAGEADHRRPRGTDHRPAVHRAARQPDRSQRRAPGLAQPPCGPSDVVVPQRVAARHEHIDPGALPRADQHRAAAAAAAHDRDALRRAPFGVGVGVGLGRAEHQRRGVGLEHPEPPPAGRQFERMELAAAP